MGEGASIMFLNKNIAEKIILELKDAIEYHINIINNNGFIIASTDLQRVDGYHEGALIVIENDGTEIIVEYDEQYRGCKKGVNLPIYFSNELVGVVGLTGNPNEVVKYARIIKKMTEMVLYEHFDLWNRTSREQVKLLFVNDLISGNLHSSFFNVEERLQKYNLNTKGPYNVALLKVVETGNELINSKINDAKQNIVTNYILDKLSYRNILAVYNGNLFVIITNLDIESVTKEIEYLISKLKEIHGVSLLSTIGNTYDFYGDIPKSYNECISILESLNQREGVYPFYKAALNVAISKIPEAYKKTLKNQVFAECTNEEIKEFVNFIQDYVLLNGSLNLLAKKNHVHKNTVQYKIQKLKDKTDYDLRIYKDMLLLYLASNY
ncbi:sugar diacid recognition domain-containing protein [Alkalicoccus saliphilus]|uniref:Sugar diacid utilization regulator n=1 Tax=Alkalicoccus saliphilus TaxID=200989 RepID=A0A2T4U4R1_9BACI|nr:sugar diacid recognition domain-containing protein [Alkalicoccus saliphilus]PTL38383.1 hypothetical protein C6Y45_11530 [Alkalicoccus saliphilus]